jgi:hypothetical protein
MEIFNSVLLYVVALITFWVSSKIFRVADILEEHGRCLSDLVAWANKVCKGEKNERKE